MAACVAVVAFSVSFVIAKPALALTPESPEVRQLVAKGVERLTQPGADERLGAKCVVAIALIKAGQGDHPRVSEALTACGAEASEAREMDVYSHGLAIILLCEANQGSRRDLLRGYVNAMYDRQKDHGGWGYNNQKTGDTSQTQYMALAMWEAHNRGLAIEKSAVDGLLEWLVGTQGPNGEWGYQGKYSATSERLNQSGVTPTMSAAALSSLMIGADLFGRLQMTDAVAIEPARPQRKELPTGVRRKSQADNPTRRAPLSGSEADWARVSEASRDGETWFDKNFNIEAKRYGCYYLYSLERYQSFREFRDGVNDRSPEWYKQGFEYLKANQSNPGEWNRGCGAEADTAFSVLFLLRSTQKSLRRAIGEGALVSGRGLPKRLAGARLSRGRVVAEVDDVEIADFLSLVSDGEAERLDALADGPAALLAGAADLSEPEARQLQQLLRGGKPDARIVAARALGAGGDLDRAPDLLYALTDPDPRVVIAARDGLRRISRRPLGFGLPDAFEDDDRWAALESWKRWYLGVRPNAVLELD